MALKKVGVELEASGASVFASQINDANQAVTTFGRDAEKAGGGVSSFGEIATGALRKVGAVAVEMGIAAGKAIAGFVSDSIGKAGDFQSGMNEFAAVTGGALDDSGKSLKDFSDLFIQMGRELPVSTADVQEAAIELAKGGIDPATIAAGGLRTALNLAAAGGVELGDSANILAKQLGVWVDAAADADTKSAFLTKTADLLSQAANVTTSDVSEMALGLANAGGTAKTAGLSYQELVQTMALVSPGFSSAADAGTSLKTFLSRLIPSTDKAAAAMVDLGLATKDGNSKFYDAQGQFIGMQAAADLLQQSTAGLSEAQRLQAFQTIFGADAIRVAAMVAEQGGQGYAAMGAQMAAAGTVSEQAAARQQGYNTALENAKGSVEALQLTVGTYLLPVLASLLNDYISPAINAVTTFADAFLQSTDKIGMLGTALTTLGTTVGTWITQQGPIWAAQILSWGEAFLSWIAPLEAQYLQYLGNLALAIGAWIIAQAPGWAKQLAAWGEQFVAWIAPQIPPLLAKAQELSSQFLAWIAAQAAPILAKLQAWAKSFVDWIVPATKDFLAKWPTMFNQFLDWIGAQAGPLLKKFGDWAVSFVAWILPMIPPILAALAGVAAAIVVWIGETAWTFLEKLRTSWIPAFYKWVEEVWPKLQAALINMRDQINVWLDGANIWLRGKAAELGNFLVQGIKDGISRAWGSFIGWINDQIAKIPAAIRKVLGIGSPSKLMADDVGKPIVQGIQLGVDQATPELKRRLINLGAAIPPAIASGITAQQPSPVKQALLGHLDDSSLATEAAEKAHNLGALIEKHVVKGLMEQAEEFRRNVVNLGAPQILDDAAEKGAAVGKAYVEGMAAGARGAANSFISAISGIASGRTFGDGPPNAGGAVNNPGGNLGGGGTVSPPASPGQQFGATSYANSVTNNYHYAPSYGSAPNAPSQDFYIMQVLSR